MLKEKLLAGELYKKQILWGFLFVFPAYLFYIPELTTNIFLYLYVNGYVTMDIELANLVVNCIIGLLTTILSIFLLRQFLKENFKALLANIKQSALWTFPIGLFLVYGLSILGNLLVVLLTGTPDSEATNQVIVESMFASWPAFMFIQAVILAPIYEELLFRGLVFRSLSRYSLILAHTVSAVTFGLLHTYTYILQGDLVQLIHTIPYALMGLAFSIGYAKTGNIYVSIAIHALNNFVSFLIISSL